MQHANVEKAKIIFKIIGEIIKEKRCELNRSQYVLALEYDIQRSLLNRLEQGESEPRLTSLLTVLEALNLAPSEFFKEVEKRLPENFSLIEQ